MKYQNQRSHKRALEQNARSLSNTSTPVCWSERSFLTWWMVSAWSIVFWSGKKTKPSTGSCRHVLCCATMTSWTKSCTALRDGARWSRKVQWINCLKHPSHQRLWRSLRILPVFLARVLTLMTTTNKPQRMSLMQIQRPKTAKQSVSGAGVWLGRCWPPRKRRSCQHEGQDGWHASCGVHFAN